MSNRTKTATEAQISAIRSRAYNDVTRAMRRDGVCLSHDQAAELGEEAIAWLRSRLDMTMTQDEDGLSFKVDNEEITKPMRAAGAASRRVTDGLDDARRIAIEAIRALEQRTQRELAGARILGMINLGTKRHPVYGARVRGKLRDKPLEIGDPPALVISYDGMLRTARVFGTPGGRVIATVHDALDSDLQLEDMEAYAKCLAACLERHVAQADIRTVAFERVADFARTILRAVAAAAPLFLVRP